MLRRGVCRAARQQSWGSQGTCGAARQQAAAQVVAPLWERLCDLLLDGLGGLLPQVREEEASVHQRRRDPVVVVDAVVGVAVGLHKYHLYSGVRRSRRWRPWRCDGL